MARAGQRKRSRETMTGAAGATAATLAEEEDEEAAVFTSGDVDESTKARRGGGRRTVEIPGAAAVLTRVALSCKIKPMMEGEGRGVVWRSEG